MRNLMNYRDLKMCGRCFAEVHSKEIQDQANAVVGGKIIKVEISEPDTYGMYRGKPPIVITSITVQTKDGKTVTLNKQKEVHYLL